jgi:hypothetical protein
MTTSRLSLYKNALLACGLRGITSLSENRESRRVLDTVWDDGAVEYCLEQGFFRFSIRTQQRTYDPSIDPDFGYQYAYPKPDDYIRTYSLCSDENLSCPIINYADEDGYWFTDFDTIYVQYVSDDDEFGFNYSAWPQTFTTFVELYLASMVCERLTQSTSKKEKIDKDLKRARIDARSKDVMNNPARFLHRGSWSNARSRGRWSGFNAILPST